MSNLQFRFEPVELPAQAAGLRAEVRSLLDEERRRGALARPDRVGMAFSAEFSRKLGERGWIGMTWPKRYGGHERTALDRYVVTEELLAAGAPVRGHWTADRQSGPVLLRFGSELQKQTYLPRIATGECYFCIGLSEPDSGSDLASIRTRARKVEGGWRLSGTKLWTTNAHNAHYMIALCRTSPAGEQRHAGLSQFIVDMATPGLTVRPVINMAGEHDFNEVVLDEVFVPDDGLVGECDNGWNQVSAELAFERSGPERWLSTFRLLAELAQAAGRGASAACVAEIGRLTAHLVTLRQMSMSVAGMLQAGRTPNVEAAIVKDLGTRFEQEVVQVARTLLHAENLGRAENAAVLRALIDHACLYAPVFTIRGGTSEILRGAIARGLGLR